ncbi:unnamed protein product [Mytilus coruscus]|uniref:Uncharacterized protein n=1 Tax=Mytilus coruscus TaxID=42192 RepID=A0A6J8D3Z7_MYTCO|nr:unnamed protein product [Mytilus coruscus]
MSEEMLDFLGDDEENFALSQISEEDVDNLALSKFCGEMEDDMSLSQIAMKIEKDYADYALCQGGDRNIENFPIPLQFESFVAKESFDDTNLVAESDFDLFQTAIFDLGLNFGEMQAPNDRFTTVVTDEEISNLVNEKMNANTKKNTKWAVGVFNQWRSFRTQNGDAIIELHMMNAECMNYWLERFVMETRKQNGDEYPPKSLYYIVCGLLRHCRDMNVHDKNFLDQKDGRFAHFRRVLDAKMKDLLSKGLGTKVRRADPVSDDDEEKGRDEHRNLDHSQFETGQDATGRFVRFIGRNNKTFKGGLGDLRLDNKDIKHYASDKHRYGKSPLGVNKLNGLMREMCEKGGLVGNFTNHSGKRTCATALYQAGIDEQQIMERTGHRSTKGVRTYKIANANTQKRVSDVLNPPSDRNNENFQESVQSKIKSENAVAEPFQRSKKHCLGDITNTCMNGSGPGSAVTFSNCHLNFN